MNAPEYVANFFLVIIGFAVSEVLKGSARLIRERHRIKFYWPYLVVVPVVFEVLMFVFLWLFTEINNRTDPDWSLEELIVISLVVIPFAFMSYLMFPSGIKDGFDMKKFYIDNARVVMIIMMVQVLVVLVLMIMSGNWKGVAAQTVLITLSALVLRNFEKFHLVWLIATMLLMNYIMFFLLPISIK